MSSSIAKFVEISAESPNSFKEAIEDGIARISKTVENVHSAWVSEEKIIVKDGKVTGWRVIMRVAFVVK